MSADSVSSTLAVAASTSGRAIVRYSESLRCAQVSGAVPVDAISLSLSLSLARAHALAQGLGCAGGRRAGEQGRERGWRSGRRDAWRAGGAAATDDDARQRRQRCARAHTHTSRKCRSDLRGTHRALSRETAWWIKQQQG